jgi:uncharacterized protein (DUF1697 family)
MTSGTRHAAFIRAINVAGHAVVTMDRVRDAFTAAGCRNVRSYIQSGNVLFDAPGATSPLFRKVRSNVGALIGEEPVIMFRTIRQLARIVMHSPFGDLPASRAVKLYVVFLARRSRTAPKLPLRLPKEALELIAIRGQEAYVVSRRKKNGFYGFPNNFVEAEVGVPATSRNWSTVTRIVALPLSS